MIAAIVTPWVLVGWYDFVSLELGRYASWAAADRALHVMLQRTDPADPDYLHHRRRYIVGQGPG